MHQEVLLVRDEGPVQIITINRPDQLNALNHHFFAGLEKCIQDLKTNSTVRAVIITGAGSKAFAAGADITELQHLNSTQAAALSSRVQTLFQDLRELPMPVIAAVNGFALGGGLELALACDFIYASDNAILGLVETNLGLIPGYAGVRRLMQSIGANQAKEALYTARKFSAQESLKLGMVNRVVPSDQLMPQAFEAANNIAQKSKNSIVSLKKLSESLPQSSDVAQQQLEQNAFGLLFSDPDATEGIAAFLEKRTPNFGKSEPS